MMVSDYFCKLDEIHRARYLTKINEIQEDPYRLKIEELSSDMNLLPKITYPDIINYLINAKSAFTLEEMKAYKSLDAYNQAVCGWVKNVAAKSFGDYVLVLGKVMHSQRLNKKLLSPWIISKKDGVICFAHCDCIGGLSETCTHVAAVLFSIEISLRHDEATTVTGKKAYWMPPTNKPAQPKRVNELDFETPQKKMYNRPFVTDISEKSDIPEMSVSERHAFLKKLQMSTAVPSVTHLVTALFANEIKQKLESKKRLVVMYHYKKENEEKTLEELKELGMQLDISIDFDSCKSVAKETFQQAKDKAWFTYRSGRITASKFKSVVEKPSVSLIKSICYPRSFKLRSKALDHGCSHEQEAINDFLPILQKSHRNVVMDKIGLFINPNWPYFGASPDCIATCDCCGSIIVEIKCPYCAKNKGVIQHMSEKNNFYLKSKSGNITLDINHSYYYQVQMQMALTHIKNCYLVVWSEKNTVFTKIPFNEEFWNRESKKATEFFYNVIFPEALGKYFTRRVSEVAEDE